MRRTNDKCIGSDRIGLGKGRPLTFGGEISGEAVGGEGGGDADGGGSVLGRGVSRPSGVHLGPSIRPLHTRAVVVSKLKPQNEGGLNRGWCIHVIHASQMSAECRGGKKKKKEPDEKWKKKKNKTTEVKAAAQLCVLAGCVRVIWTSLSSGAARDAAVDSLRAKGKESLPVQSRSFIRANSSRLFHPITFAYSLDARLKGFLTGVRTCASEVPSLYGRLQSMVVRGGA